MTPAERKAQLRREALARRDALDPASRARASAAVAERVRAWLAASPPMVVSAFWPIRSEIDPRPIIQALAAAGHPTALPSVTDRGLVFRLWAPGERLVKAGFGLSEPPAGNPEIQPELMLVPLAAFDRRGHRIGYGAGYYDRAIGQRPGVRTIGLAFAAQEVERVPDEPHDRALDAVATEHELILPAATEE
ncbi:5-formyltetrahydrofolate cyclo-ligase [Alsobacter sp. R-9]